MALTLQSKGAGRRDVGRAPRTATNPRSRGTLRDGGSESTHGGSVVRATISRPFACLEHTKAPTRSLQRPSGSPRFESLDERPHKALLTPPADLLRPRVRAA